LGNNINSNNFLEVLIAGLKLTPRVKYVSKCKGNRRVKTVSWIFYTNVFYNFTDEATHSPVCL